MTICVGIKCKDGIVIGSDSMLSHGQLFSSNNKKTYQVTTPIGEILVAIADSDGLGKRFINFLNNQDNHKKIFYNNDVLKKDALNIVNTVNI